MKELGANKEDKYLEGNESVQGTRKWKYGKKEIKSCNEIDKNK